MKPEQYFAQYPDTQERENIIRMAWEGFGRRSKVAGLFLFSSGTVCLIGFILAPYLWGLIFLGCPMIIGGALHYSYVKRHQKLDLILQKQGHKFLQSVYQEFYNQGVSLGKKKIKKYILGTNVVGEKILFKKQLMLSRPTFKQRSGIDNVGGLGRFTRASYKRAKLVACIGFYTTRAGIVIVPKEAAFLTEKGMGTEDAHVDALTMVKHLPKIDLFSSVLRYADKGNTNEIILMEFHNLSVAEFPFSEIISMEFNSIWSEYAMLISLRDGRQFLINASPKVFSWLRDSHKEFNRISPKRESLTNTNPFELNQDYENTLGTGKLCPMCTEIVQAGEKTCKYCSFTF
jgi:hypothetical protein